jgi:small subunit ribosomal protein S2
MTLTAQSVVDHQLHIGSLQKESSPKTREFWSEVVNGVVVLDPDQIVEHLEHARIKVREAVLANKNILVVLDKASYAEDLNTLATKHNFHYLHDKVPGGFLTNFETLMTKIKDLNRKIAFEQSNEFNSLTKKEQTKHSRDVRKINNIYGGVKNLKKKPDLVIAVDGAGLTNFLHEVKKQKIDNVVLSSTDFSERWNDNSWVVANMNSYKSLDYIMHYLFS